MDVKRPHGASYDERMALLRASASPVDARRLAAAHAHAVHAHKPTTLRQDIWTVLRFRSSIRHRSGLQAASYILELCILVLILLNVVLAIMESPPRAVQIAPGGAPSIQRTSRCAT